MSVRIRNVLRKEWAVMVRSPSSLLFLVGIPLLLTGQAIFLSWVIPRFVSPGSLGVQTPPGEEISDIDALRLLILSQFRFFILLIPAMIANTFATMSIVEEKLTRTLEPLLATPVRTWELLFGKVLFGAIPAVLITWGCAGLFVLLVGALGWGHLIGSVVSTSWFLVLFLLAPAVSILSFLLGVIGSSRAADAKSAQNLAILIVLPIFALIAVQVTGLVCFTPLLTLLLSFGMAAADGGLVLLAVRLFDRESIVVRWR